ncbi:MAG: SRPBCC domain-containing protein [Flavipsychrobacter sp.]|nr:SRPBCC domain-containing protein [Flavipsychrobacter sp.]
MDTTRKEVIVSKLLKASRERVYRAWTDPEQFSKWWGPEGYDIPVCEFDLRPGGALRIDMSGAGGWLMRMDGNFVEVVDNEKLVFTTAAFPDEEGNPTHEHLNTILFAEEEGGTRVTVTVTLLRVPEGAAAVDGLSDGWKSSLDQLEQRLFSINQ